MKLIPKISLFLLPILVVIGFNIKLLSKTGLPNYQQESVFLLGSSRVQQQFDPSLWQDSVPCEVINLGVMSSTFLHNVIMAEHIIDKYQPKKLLIELSPSIHNLNQTHLALSLNKAELSWKYFNIMECIEATDNYMFYYGNLKSSMKNLAIGEPQKLHYGFSYTDQNQCDSISSFLRFDDIQSPKDIDISEHRELVERLDTKANKANVEVVYFLPFTFKRQLERDLVVAVYHSLPENKRIPYTEDFIQDVSKSEYLFDNNHFNAKGAEVVTNYFTPYLCTQ